MLMRLLTVACGGAAGSVLRYLVSLAAARWLPSAVPIGTLGVNVVGCFCGGVLLVRLGAAASDDPRRLWLMVGLLGGLTTFSAFGVETVALAQKGQVAAAVLNVALNVSLGLAGVALGAWVAR